MTSASVVEARPFLNRRFVAGALVALVLAAPLLVMIVGSFRGLGLPPPRSIEVIPRDAGIESYRSAFELAPLGRSLLNSFIIAVISAPIAILTASWAGFAIAELPDRRRKQLIVVVLLLLMVPVTALWLTRFVVFKWLGLIDTRWALIVPALMGGSPFAVLLYAYAFGRIPRDVFDAARLEGASALTIWRRIAFPLVRATTVAVGMLAFVASWSNFIDPLLYLSSEEKFTAPLTLRYLEQLGPTNWPVLLAGSVIVTLPVLVVFLLAQRYFLQEERGVGWLGR